MADKEHDPQMHTVEHLINGTMDRMLGCGRAFSTHIDKRKLKCDFHFDRNLTAQEREILQTTVNTQLSAELPVWDEELEVGVATRSYNLSRLPAGAERVRIVHIGTCDACPCVGNHVTNTREVPPMEVISSDWNEGVLRVRFKCCKN